MDLDKYVRIPLYNVHTGQETGEAVEIPLVILRNVMTPIRVLGQEMRIVRIKDDG